MAWIGRANCDCVALRLCRFPFQFPELPFLKWIKIAFFWLYSGCVLLFFLVSSQLYLSFCLLPLHVSCQQFDSIFFLMFSSCSFLPHFCLRFFLFCLLWKKTHRPRNISANLHQHWVNCACFLTSRDDCFHPLFVVLLLLLSARRGIESAEMSCWQYIIALVLVLWSFVLVIGWTTKVWVDQAFFFFIPYILDPSVSSSSSPSSLTLLLCFRRHPVRLLRRLRLLNAQAPLLLPPFRIKLLLLLLLWKVLIYPFSFANLFAECWCSSFTSMMQSQHIFGVYLW